MAFLPGVIRAILDNDSSPLRFETFCCDLYGAEGGVILPTSRTRDLGRDGRSLVGGDSEFGTILCATLREDIDPKVRADIARLADTTPTASVVYCSSKPLTEEKCDLVRAEIHDIHPTVESVTVLGQHQLVALVDRHEEVFQRHYSAEISTVEDAMLRPESMRDTKEIGLRLALCTQAGDDASEMRTRLVRCLVLHALQGTGGLTANQLSSLVSAQLHLPRTLSADFLSGLLGQLSDDGLVTIDEGRASLTSAGDDAIASEPENASTVLLQGRTAVREAIAVLSGHKLSETRFSTFWKTFEDGIASLFYEHGLAIIKMVRSVLGEESGDYIEDDFYLQLERLGDRLAAGFADHTLASEVRQAAIDMFFEKGISVFEWLTQICGVFVMMCSLGLESLSSREVVRVLSTHCLVPDSDVLISLLCEGEDNHDTVLNAIRGWRAIGGRLHLAVPVLEEVAYHAWISENDYYVFGPKLGDISDDEASHTLANAFVRAFRRVAGKRTAPKYWNSFIRQYRGSREYDYARIVECLRDEHSFEVLTEDRTQYESLVAEVQEYMLSTTARYRHLEPARLDHNTRDKISRDARLIGVVHAHRQERVAAGEPPNTCIVSSARLLRETGNAFEQTLGEPEVVMSIPAVAFLLTLVPQVGMSLSSLRQVLFDADLATRLTPAQRYAYRVIAASGERDLPWSRRKTLERELGNVLRQDALQRAEPESALWDKVMTTRDPQYSAAVVGAAMDRMAATPKTTEEVQRLKRALEQATQDLAAARQSRKAAAVPGKKTPPRFRRKRR